MTEVEKIAPGLTDGEALSLNDLSDVYCAWPYLGTHTISHILSLRDAGLVGREFLDVQPMSWGAHHNGLTGRVSAAWHFRLTPLGLAIRQYLQEQSQ